MVGPVLEVIVTESFTKQKHTPKLVKAARPLVPHYFRHCQKLKIASCLICYTQNLRVSSCSYNKRY